ncbi:MAG TPA: galactose-1-phosphate uridylyltransferase [Candidatus Omnitrophota bacterium]|nr:galactose-1-phosphate uridylyltransferase [Candidatus Omnitrophota bacterium]HPS19651.1 galactose-1-phosphate uridylyltransferase [Candidatus Omnitrophota bacterium]
MSELRFNYIMQDWVIIATERANKPETFKKEKCEETIPAFDPKCPFCPGNEGDGKDETARIGDVHSWKVRAIYNKYPALSPDVKEERKIFGIHNKAAGFGVHEVVVENPRHDVCLATMPEESVFDVVKMYKMRYEAIRCVNGIEAITIFKNHGEMAGASQKHPHSQIVATSVVPHHIRSRVNNSIQFFDIMRKCVVCAMIEQELKDKERMVLETENFVAFVPYAAVGPFLVWIVPKRHMASFDATNDTELRDFAVALKTVLAKIYTGLNNPDFNFTVRSMPTKESGEGYFHWALVMYPRIKQLAGFELGSGMCINSTIPEACAEFLRGVRI